MIGFSPKTIARRKLAIIFLLILLVILYIPFNTISWSKELVFQAELATISFCLAGFVGAMAFVKLITRKKNKYLYVAAGFLGAGLLEGYSIVVSSGTDSALWIASRIFLSAFLLLSIKDWREDEAKKGIRPRVYIASVILVVLIIAAVSLMPSFNSYGQFLIFGRPLEVAAAALFGLTAFAYLRKGYWKFKFFELWFLVSLITAFAGEIYMSLSTEFLDAMFYSGYFLKILSYLSALVGLFLSTYGAFKEFEAEKKIHAGMTSGAYYLKQESSK